MKDSVKYIKALLLQAHYALEVNQPAMFRDLSISKHNYILSTLC